MIVTPSLKQGYLQSRVYMDTIITIELSRPPGDRLERVQRAFGWFDEVERCCNRFDPASELRRLLLQPGQPMRVSPLLFRAVEFALAVSRESGGAFDPTLGARLEAAGFSTDYRSGDSTPTGLAPAVSGGIDDLVLDAAASTITLLRPLVLDLGAVAKGFAMDLAAQELRDAGGFAINAGGDVLCGGLNADGKRWRIGIRHPRLTDTLLHVLALSDAAVCTSGDYERGQHIVDPRTGASAAAAVAVTAIGPSAMVADALSTAAFVMGPERGRDFLAGQGLEGMVVDSGLAAFETEGYRSYLA